MEAEGDNSEIRTEQGEAGNTEVFTSTATGRPAYVFPPPEVKFDGETCLNGRK